MGLATARAECALAARTSRGLTHFLVRLFSEYTHLDARFCRSGRNHASAPFTLFTMPAYQHLFAEALPTVSESTLCPCTHRARLKYLSAFSVVVTLSAVRPLVPVPQDHTYLLWPSCHWSRQKQMDHRGRQTRRRRVPVRRCSLFLLRTKKPCRRHFLLVHQCSSPLSDPCGKLMGEI